MNSLKFITSNSEPNPEDKKALVKGMLHHHASHGHPRKTEVFSIFLKDQRNKAYGGVIVSFLYSGMEIQALWGR